jgi:GNAT superfamily N-acetyltransferase
VTTRRIRFAQPDEASTLSRVALRSKAHWGYDNSFLESCRAELDVPPSACDGTHVIVAIEDATLARFARISGGQPEGELSALFVDPPFMKQGVGGDLLRAVMVQASALGLRRLLLDSDPGAEGFYLRAGAVRVGDTPSGSIPGRLLPRLRLDIHNE